MKKGGSLYYASDKNIFDALNQSKVDSDTIQAMFRRRNIVSSKQTKREDLARFFSRLTHDFLDHQDLSDRLGIVPKRERVTAVDLIGIHVAQDVLQRAVDSIKSKLHSQGDLAHISVDGAVLSVAVKYSVIDYRKSEFSQLQHRKGLIELRPEKGRLVVRSTKSEYLDEVRDDLIRTIQAEVGAELKRREISLFHHPEHNKRSLFFYELMTNLPGYVRRDVTDVFVYKPRPLVTNSDDDDLSDPHIDRIFLRGVGVSQSELLQQLTNEKEYYIAKVGWIATASSGAGGRYEIEAMFTDPSEFTGFSYILKGVYDLDEKGKFSKYRRSPTAAEIDSIARTIESKARQLVENLDSTDKSELIQ